MNDFDKATLELYSRHQRILDFAAMNRLWVPVEKELPEEGKSVLVCYRSGWSRVEVGLFRDGHWAVPGAGTYRTKLVTHWMPLPEPPHAKG